MIHTWLNAKCGEMIGDKVKAGKLNKLAFRPGWHTSKYPIAPHIGKKREGKIVAMHDNHVWCECFINDNINYQNKANEKDGEVLLNQPLKKHQTEEVPTKDDEECELTLRSVFDFATTTPLEEIEFIKEARRLNENASREALKGNYGHSLGKTLSRPLGKGIMGDSIFSHILSATSSACDARMAGASIPVMSNSGSNCRIAFHRQCARRHRCSWY